MSGIHLVLGILAADEVDVNGPFSCTFDRIANSVAVLEEHFDGYLLRKRNLDEECRFACRVVLPSVEHGLVWKALKRVLDTSPPATELQPDGAYHPGLAEVVVRQRGRWVSGELVHDASVRVIQHPTRPPVVVSLDLT